MNMNHPLLDLVASGGHMSDHPEEEEVLLSDRSGRILFRNKPVALTITREHVFLHPILSMKEQKDNSLLRKKSEDVSNPKKMTDLEKRKWEKLKAKQHTPILTLSVEDLIGMHYFPVSASGKVSKTPIDFRAAQDITSRKSTNDLKSNKKNDKKEKQLTPEELRSITSFKVEFYLYIPKKHFWKKLLEPSHNKLNSKKVFNYNNYPMYEENNNNTNMLDQEHFGFESAVKFPLDRVLYTLNLFFEQSYMSECIMWKRAVHEAARQIVFMPNSCPPVAQNNNVYKTKVNEHKADNPLLISTENERSSSFSSQSQASAASSPVPPGTNNTTNTPSGNSNKRVTRYSHNNTNINNNTNNNNSSMSYQTFAGSGILNTPYSPGAYHPHHRNTYFSALHSQNGSVAGSKNSSYQNPQNLLAASNHSNKNSIVSNTQTNSIVFPVFNTDDLPNNNNNNISDNIVNNNTSGHVFDTTDPFYDASFEDMPHPADPPYYPGYFRPVQKLERHFLVIISPKSGAGQSLKHWQKTVEPMLKQADITYDTIVTEYYRHAFHLAQHKLSRNQWLSYDCVLLLGGDGIVYELINGLLCRTDSDASSTTSDTTPKCVSNPSESKHYAANLALLRRVTLCPLGGGSGNGLAASILHETLQIKQNMHHMVYIAVKGFRHGLDLTKVTTSVAATNNDDKRDEENNETAEGAVSQHFKQEQFAFLTLMWGMLSDIDLDSEWLRCLGELRLYVYAVKSIAMKKTYRCRLSLQLVRSWSTYTSEGSFYEHRVNQLLTNNTVNVHEKQSDNKQQPETLDADGWLTLEDDFIAVNVFQVSHIATSTHMCPGKKLDEGFFLVVLVNKSISRASMIHLLLTADDGGLLQNPHVRVFRCAKYVLQPLPSLKNKQKNLHKLDGKYSLDGERVPYGTISGEIIPNAARIMM